MDSTLWRQIQAETKAVLCENKMCSMMLLLPLAVAADTWRWSDGAVFVLAMLPLCSLAERLGMITEQLALYTNDTIGGLLNASFGNATEVIIAAFALKQGSLRIVQLTLLGSIISNLLLVLGSAFIAGGLMHRQQQFSQQGINVNCGLLVVATVAIALPSLLSETHTEVTSARSELVLSRFESVFMLLCYGLYLVFQLVTHRHLYESAPSLEDDKTSHGGATVDSGGRGDGGGSGLQTLPVSRSANNFRPNGGHGRAELELMEANGNGGMGFGSPSKLLRVESSRDYINGEPPSPTRSDEELLRPGNGNLQFMTEVEEEGEEKVLSKTGCFVWLAIVTVLISILSDYIMGAIRGASKQLKVPMPFLTTIIVPIVGNAAEHASAVVFAYRNRIEISLGVAVGSSTQIAVLVAPFCVLLGWAMGQPLDLNFNSFESCTLFISVLLSVVVVQDGHGNWMKGAMLLLTYFFIAAGFWAHYDKDLTDLDPDRP